MATVYTAPAALPGAGVYFDPNSYWNKQYETDEKLRDALAYAYSGRAYQPTPFWNDPTMLKYARENIEAFDQDIPYHNDGGKWADRAWLYFFAQWVLYAKQFDFKLYYTQEDCHLLPDLAQAINQEKEHASQQRAAGAYGDGELSERLNSLNKMSSIVATAQVKLNCTQYLKDQEEAKNIAVLTALSDSATQDVANQSTDKKSNKWIKYVLYGIAGLILIGGIALLVKKKPAA